MPSSKKITTENMKKKIIFNLLSLIFILSSLSAHAVRTMTANPINIASRLILYTDSAKVANILGYYGYELSSENSSASAGLSQGEATIFRHPDGTIIRFTFPKTEAKEKFPTVQVKSKVPKTEAEKILKDLNYTKTDSGYETTSSKFSNHTTRCTFDPGNTITLRCLPK